MAKYPERIVCLTEETTETLYLLGQGHRIVGVSGYTVRPPEARAKPKVSAFVSARFDKIEALQPDLVLAFSDLQADLSAALVKRGIPVVFGPMDSFAYKTELKHESWRNARFLIESGVEFGLMTDHPVVLQRELLWGNAWHGAGDLLVVEADESDGSLVHYSPAIGVVLNLHRDHKEMGEVAELFAALKANTREAFERIAAAVEVMSGRIGEIAAAAQEMAGGARSVVDRFAQVEPTVLLVVAGYRFGAKDVDRSEEVAEIRREGTDVTGIVTADGSFHPADIVVSNIEVIPAYQQLLGEDDDFMKSLEKFEPACSGLILDLGVRGFLPASLVDIRRVQDLEDFLGQTLRCKVIELNRSRNNVVLSRRAVLEDERKEMRQAILDRLSPGDVIEGQISNIVDFGAFVDLDGMDGLIHISELSWSHVNHPSEVLDIGQTVKVKVLDIDRDRQRISLGLKQTQTDP